MTKRIICAVLLICTLLSCFSVFAFASTDTASAASNEVADEGFNEYIDIDEYRENAGKEGYTDMLIVGADIPRIVSYNQPVFNSQTGNYDIKTVYYYEMDLYIYNPLKEYVYSSESNYSSLGTLTVDFPGMDEEEYSNSHYAILWGWGGADLGFYNDMFIKAYIKYQVGNQEGMFLDDYTMYLKTLELKTYSGVTCDSDYGEGDIDKIYTFEINHKFEDLHIDEKIFSTTPLRDFSVFFDTDVKTLKEVYPEQSGQQPTQAFMYLAEGKVYLYVYDPSSNIYGQSHTTMNIGFTKDKMRQCNFRYHSKEGAIRKYYVPVSEISDIVDLENASIYTDNFSYYTVTLNDKGVYKPSWQTLNETFEYTFSKNIEGQKTVKANGESIVLEEVGVTSYSLNNSIKGTGYVTTLQTVYFNVPYYFFEKHDSDPINDRHISNVKGEYESAMTNPIIATADKEFYNILKTYEHLPEITDIYVCCGCSNYNYYCDCDILIGEHTTGSNSLFNDIYDYYYSHYSCLFELSEYIPSLTQLSNSQIESALANSSHPFSEDFVKSVIDLNSSDVQDLISRKELTFFEVWEQNGFIGAIVEKWLGQDEFDDSIKNINAILSLDETAIKQALTLEKSDFCEKYLVSEESYSDICKKMQEALNNEEMFVMLRFDVFDQYKSSDVKSGRYVTVDRYNTFVMQYKLYRNFDIFTMTMTNDYDSVVYTVDMEPINFIGGTAETPEQNKIPLFPEFPNISDILGGGGKNNGNEKSWWEKLLEAIQNGLGYILAIVGTVLIVIVAVIFFEPIKTVVSICWGGIKRFFGAIGKGIKKLFKRE